MLRENHEMLTDFDPYHELQIVIHNTQQLIRNHNRHDQLLLDIADQHTRLTAIIKNQQLQIDHLQRQLKAISQQ